jgi:general secretion pathway protein E
LLWLLKCDLCFNTGYLGREAIVELIDINDTIRQIIYEGTITHMNAYLNEEGFDSFRLSAIDKVTSGITTVEEVQRVLPRSSLQYKSVPTLFPVTPNIKLFNHS